MRQNGPTLPGHDWNDQGPEAGSPLEPYSSGPAPIWPDARARRAFFTESTQEPRGYVSATLFAVSVGANVALLIGLIGLILLSYSGVFPPGGASRLAPGTALSPTGSPTLTVTPAPSPTAGSSGWLQVSPASVRLGCNGSKQTQYVVLRNTGPNQVSWQAQLSGSGDQAGVSVDPHDGTLDSGQSVSIQVQNTTQSSAQQGVIQFAASSEDAGAPASVTYNAAGC
ncbi:MAG TPA: hypothetical protein VF808_06285 [Ktedonobacterales bacterium]